MESLDADVLFASFIKNHLGNFNRVYDSHWSLHFIIGGHAQLQIADKHYSLEGAWFWAGYAGPQFIQDAGSPLPVGHYRAALRGAHLQSWLDQGLWPTEPMPISNTAEMSACFETLLQRLHGSTAVHQRRRMHAVEGILLEAWSQQEQAPQQELWLERCCELLDAETCNHHVDYQVLANRLYIPLPTLRRRFRQAMGQPMHRYVLTCRCQRAQDLLLSTEDNLDSVATALGYEDVAYFSRQFKQMCGLSPSTFRQQRYY